MLGVNGQHLVFDFSSSCWENRTCVALPHALCSLFLLSSWLISPQPPTFSGQCHSLLPVGSKMERLDKEHRGKSDPEWRREGRKVGGCSLDHPANLRAFDRVVGGILEPSCHQRNLASKEQAATFSRWPEVPMGSTVSTHGDGFQRAATGPWAIKFPELRGLWGPCLWLSHLESSSPHPYLANFYSFFKFEGHILKEAVPNLGIDPASLLS